MAKLKIYTFPDIVLTKKSALIQRVEKSYFKFADDMLETMYEAPGIGLAANQVGVLEKFLVIDTEYEVTEAEGSNEQFISGKKPLIVINPEIIYREGKTAIEEACLSVPSYQAEVQRSEKIKVQFQDINGLTQVLSAEGLLAVCIQHEMDHLDGTLFIDRLSKLKQDFAKKKLIKARKLREE
jgi:peptide deformylase